MKFGVALFPLRVEQMKELVPAAEEMGFDSVWLGEHVVTPLKHDSKFPYSPEAGKDSHDAFHANLPFYDPYAALGYLAAITSTMKLAVSISIVPLHDPFHLARSAMTLDLFSNGRFMFGAGSGWLKEEFDIMGRDFKTRGKRLDETLDVMVSLFNEEVTTYDGETLKIPPVAMSPKPASRPNPPFFFGGHAKVALRRAAHRGSGWLANEMPPEEMVEAVKTLQELRNDAGRSDIPFEVSNGLIGDVDADMVKRYEDAGCDRLVVRPWLRGRDALKNLTELADRLLK
ncbi:LLM class F420-dependent oxidoreductase [Novosphingobium marinum]|nr:LLM class F420-dependent oxidoreductase [Novosphingobium marinum]